ncbi:MAG: hypothetical protein LBS05_04070 [Tannerellaceae bacterium]|nr:hypothetical protein [Tannerellaceae bacterium]
MERRIKIDTKKKAIAAGLFALLLMIPVVFKSVHIHCERHCSEASDAVHHDCDNCPVCQFMLSLYIETPPTAPLSVPTFALVTPALRRATPYNRSYHSPSPRAPPSGHCAL